MATELNDLEHYMEACATLRHENSALEAENEQMRDSFKNYNAAMREVRASRDAALARSRSLVEALEEFGRHHAECGYLYGLHHGEANRACDCGFTAALAADPAPREEGTNE